MTERPELPEPIQEILDEVEGDDPAGTWDAPWTDDEEAESVDDDWGPEDDEENE